jgi:hypothetical protein
MEALAISAAASNISNARGMLLSFHVVGPKLLILRVSRTGEVSEPGSE